MLKVEKYSPASGTNAKDSSITIEFNKPLASECKALLDSIKINLDGVPVASSFVSKDRSLSGKKITLKNTKPLNVTGTEIKTVTVIVPSVFYYMDGDTKVNLSEDKSFEYTVSADTNSKANVSFEVTLEGSGRIERSDDNFNTGISVPLKFTLNSGYQFNGWEIIDEKENP